MGAPAGLGGVHAGRHPRRSGGQRGIGRSNSGDPWATFYVEVDDLRDCLDRAGELGGRTVLPVTELGGMAFAMFDDPDGLLVGLVRGGGTHDQIFQRPSGGDGAAVDWFEVLGSDAARSQAFYAELFGWTVPEGAYGQVRPDGGRGIGGVIGPAGPSGGRPCTPRRRRRGRPGQAEALGGTRSTAPSRPVRTPGQGRSATRRATFGVYHRPAS